jgi:cytochrome P450 family 33
MITNSEVQEKLQEELDRVISSNRIIKVSDKSDLPYCNAVIMETQRLANIVALNFFHTTTREVNIAGYTMPKGTLVIPQISVLMADPKVRIYLFKLISIFKVFPDPRRFNPLRFIDKNGHFKPAPEVMPFSVGRRQCPGEGLAKMELFLFVANLFNQYKVKYDLF